MKRMRLLRAGCFAVCLPIASLAVVANPQSIATEQFSGTSLSFTPTGNYHNVTLTVAGPHGFKVREFFRGGVTSVNLTDYGNVDDGAYKYAMSAATSEMIALDSSLNNGRGSQSRTHINKSLKQSGHFRVKGGQIVNVNKSETSE